MDNFLLWRPKQNLPFEEIEKPSVLVIEDDDMVRSAIKMMLESWHCHVQEACSIDTEQVFQTTGFTPDLILADLHLGRGTAFDCLPAFLTQNHLDSVPVIICTGDSSEDCRLMTHKQGWGFLLKPFRSETLREAMADALHMASITELRVVLSDPVPPSN